ncbi:MAG: helix-turn-helix domain-containing protein [Flavobacteriales bacterium]
MSFATKLFLIINITLGKNIKKYRELKGYSQEYMAHELDITQANYAKMENNSIKITVDRLLKIALLLETDIAELLEMKKQTIYNQSDNQTANAFGSVQNLYQENKEVYEKLIQAKDEQITLLKEQIDFYKGKNC